MKKNVPAALAALAILAAISHLSCGPNAPRERPASLNVSVQAEPWKFGDVPGTKLATRHYRIFTTSANHSLVKSLPGFLESACEHYGRLTGLSEPPGATEPMPVYLLASRPQWEAMTKSAAGPASERLLQIQSGGYCWQGVCVFWDLGHFATFATAAHEGLHQFFYNRLRDPLPAWAEEGLCVLAEGFTLTASTVTFTPQRNTLREGSLRDALSAGRWIALERLLSTDAADHVAGPGGLAPEYYAQLWALMLFIRSEPRYQAGLARLIADAAAGTLRRRLRVPEAMGAGRTYNRSVSVPIFQRYIEPDLLGFERRFRAFAERLAKLAPGGTSGGGPAPKAPPAPPRPPRQDR